MKVKVVYLSHSGYYVETENHIILFDYIKGELPKFDKTTLIISTHGHSDHFNKDILSIEGDLKILLSSDIKDDYKLEQQSNVFYIGPNSKRFVGDFQVETFGSTDKGISAFVYVDNVGIFHAGDLNLWIWDEDTDEEKKEMTHKFSEEINKIRRKNVEIAMFPLDPRLGLYSTSGISYFTDNIKPKYLFPMHMFEDYSISKDFKENLNHKDVNFFSIDGENQIFEVEI